MPVDAIASAVNRPSAEAPARAAGVAVVVVTFNRPDYLKTLLQSLAVMTTPPDRVVVVDNASTAPTAEAITAAAALFPAGVLVNHRLDTNTGGSGGFSAGVAKALELRCDWFWLMDDDVEALPDALTHLLGWGQRFKCVHGRRYDFDGSPFFWQPIFQEFLGVPLPYIRDPFQTADFMLMNSGCFEGMFIHREVVEKIGLPDPRFFITWDDAVYGWLASQVADVAYVNAFVLKRAREQRQISLVVRHLNDASDLFRFHVMRNRAYVGKYFEQQGKLNRFGFGLGTFLTFCKEILRLLAVEHRLTGIGPLLRGWREGRRIWRRTDWAPMPALDD